MSQKNFVNENKIDKKRKKKKINFAATINSIRKLGRGCLPQYGHSLHTVIIAA